MKTKYISSMILHALGDTIGFKNGDWEFNYNKVSTLTTVSEFLYEFMDLGGVNGIDLTGWRVSDDTLYNISMARGMLALNELNDSDTSSKSFGESFMLNMKNQLAESHNRMVADEEDRKILRYPGKNTEKYIEKFTDTVDARTLPYDPMSGGNGCAMRCIPIGMVLHREANISRLIECSIQTSRLTHNSPIGFLAGLNASYFASLAIQGVDLIEWPARLILLLESREVRKYIDFENNEVIGDYLQYIKYWKKYIDTRFKRGQGGTVERIKTKSLTNAIYRIKYYYENFVKDDDKAKFIGGSGFCAMIMAYDTVFDCDGKWEKLIFYGILHPGDSDTIGAIAGGLYGLVHGIGDVPMRMLEHLEEKEVLSELGKAMYDKFYL